MPIMKTYDRDIDLVAKLTRYIARKQEQLVDEHASLRESESYKLAINKIDRYIHDYGIGINAVDVMAKRHPPFFEQLISLRMKSHFVQSMIAASYMIKEGLHDPAKREMRFLVEASVKSLWLDKGSPPLRQKGNLDDTPSPGTVADKAAALDALGRKRFGDVVDSLEFSMLGPTAGVQYRQSANSLYGTLSTMTHVSSRNVERDLANFEKGRHLGFETVADVEAIAQLLRNVLDLALASHFEAFDTGLVGNLFEPPFVPNWSFLQMPLVAAIDHHFDYKHERRARNSETK